MRSRRGSSRSSWRGAVLAGAGFVAAGRGPLASPPRRARGTTSRPGTSRSAPERRPLTGLRLVAVLAEPGGSSLAAVLQLLGDVVARPHRPAGRRRREPRWLHAAGPRRRRAGGDRRSGRPAGAERSRRHRGDGGARGAGLDDHDTTTTTTTPTTTTTSRPPPPPPPKAPVAPPSRRSRPRRWSSPLVTRSGASPSRRSPHRVRPGDRRRLLASARGR